MVEPEELGSAMQGVRSLGKKGGVPGTVFPLPGAPRKRCLDASVRVLQNSRTGGAPGCGVRAKKVGSGRSTTG